MTILIHAPVTAGLHILARLLTEIGIVREIDVDTYGSVEQVPILDEHDIGGVCFQLGVHAAPDFTVRLSDRRNQHIPAMLTDDLGLINKANRYALIGLD
jgi:hypothetical protein